MPPQDHVPPAPPQGQTAVYDRHIYGNGHLYNNQGWFTGSSDHGRNDYPVDDHGYYEDDIYWMVLWMSMKMIVMIIGQTNCERLLVFLGLKFLRS